MKRIKYIIMTIQKISCPLYDTLVSLLKAPDLIVISTLALSIFRQLQQKVVSFITSISRCIRVYMLDQLYHTIFSHSKIINLKINALMKWLIKNIPSLIVYKETENFIFLKPFIGQFYLIILIFIPEILITLYLILFIISIIFFSYILTWFTQDDTFSIIKNFSPLLIPAASHKRFYANIPNFNPWLIYKDPFNSKSLDPKNIKRFINRFLDDIVSNCSDGYNIQFIFKVHFSTANTSKELIIRYFFNNEILDIEVPDSIDRVFTNIKSISRDDANIYRFETLNTILAVINGNIYNDPIHKKAQLDFDYMFIMYRYYPNSPLSLFKKSPLRFPDLSKRSYSTQIVEAAPTKQPWLVYEDPLIRVPTLTIDLNKITVETFLFNFFREIISKCSNGQLISLMFKVRYYANIDEEGPRDLKMFSSNEGYDVDRSDYIIRSFSKIQRIEHIPEQERDTIKNLLSVIMFKVILDSENYNELSFKNMFISYKAVDNADNVPKSVPEYGTSLINNSEFISLGIKHIKPTMDITTWSDKINFINDTSAFFIEDGLIYTFELDTYSYTCKIIDTKYNLVLKFRDSLSKEIFSLG